MKSKAILLIFIALSLSVPSNSQKMLTLKECYDRALSANALAKEDQAYNSIYELKDRNLSKGWLPSLDAGSMFVYNSEVVDIGSALGSLPIPGIAGAIKPLPHEQYKITVDINQTIYDGGAIKNARSLEKAELGVNQKTTETDLYKIRAQINGYFFNIMLASKQQELFRNYLKIIDERLKSMESALRNGMILKSDIDVLTSEKLKLNNRFWKQGSKKQPSTGYYQILQNLKLTVQQCLSCLNRWP
jgi:outer membrane protein TolC